VIRVATCVLLLLGGCTHVVRTGEPGKAKEQRAVLVVCVFASCHVIVQRKASELDGDD
jgi:uncharacterized protein YceK